MTTEEIKAQLKQVKYPGFSRDIVSFGIVKSAGFADGVAKVSLALTTTDPRVPKQLKDAVDQALRALPGVKETLVEVTVAPAKAAGHSSASGGRTSTAPQGLKHTIAIASGKGGVGKSTFAVNLACALEQLQAEAGRPGRIGLMDCDIYGPTVPQMMGLSGRPMIEGNGPTAQLIPMEHHGVKVMSMGFLVDEDTPVVWRGPMVTKTVTQFVHNVKWGELDVLIIDLPPGTGDAQLTLVQTLPLDGAIIVTTPQPVATKIALKGAMMFQKVNVPVLGVVENMSYFTDPAGGRHELFGAGGGIATAQKLGAALLGQVPLFADIREGGDLGQPLVVRSPQSEAAELFRDIAGGLLARLARAPAKAN